MPHMITGTAGVSPLRLLHPEPETARERGALLADGWTRSGRDLLSPEGVFHVEVVDGGRRISGVAVVIAVTDPPSSGGLRPHEQTDGRAVRRRVKALRTAHVDRDPLLLTYRGGGRVGRLLDGRTTPAYERTSDGRTVRVGRVAPDVAGEVLDLLGGSGFLVADGHHRLAGAVELRRLGEAADVTALVVDDDDTPLALGPIHRVLLDRDGREHVDDETVAAILDRCAQAGASVVVADEPAEHPTSVVLAHRERRWNVSWPGRPRTDVTSLVEHVLADEARARTRREPAEADALAAADRGALAVLLPPPSLDDVLLLAERGVLLPYKATAFEPKLPSGSLVRPLASWNAAVTV